MDGFITFIVILLAYCLSLHFTLDPGVSWHVTAAQRMLAGGNYLTNLFDDSTPSTFALFIPLIWIHQLFAGNWPMMIPAYVYFFYAISFWLCYHVLSEYYSKHFHWRSLYYTILLSVIFFSLMILGQRETIGTVFIAPYLLMTAASPRKENHKIIAWLIGLLAALAISQIPIDLIAIVTIDILCFIKRKKMTSQTDSSSTRPLSSTENKSYFLSAQSSFYFSFILIMIVSYLLYPHYFTVALPLTMCFESGYNSKAFELILFNFPSLIILILQTVLLSFNSKKQFVTVHLLIASWLFLLIYYGQNKNWYYHIYPLYIFLSLLIMMNLYQKKNINFSLPQNFFMKLLLIFIFFPALYVTTEILLSNINYFSYSLKMKEFFDTLNQFVKNKTLLTFGTQLEPTYPFVHYTNATVVTPWSNIWLIPKWVNSANPEKSICLFKVGQELFSQQTINTLTKKTPEFILLNAQKNIPYIQQENFDLLSFLNKNKKIEKLLSNYYDLTTIHHFRLLKRRNP